MANNLQMSVSPVDSIVAERIFLSPPHLDDAEFDFVREAFDSNWIAPVGPHVDAFEREFAAKVGAPHAVALSSGTAALHLAVRLCGVGPGDDVLVSSLTFCASVNPILYEGGVPVFIDSETASWNLDPNLVEDVLRRKAAQGKTPKALVAVHLYGQAADLDPLVDLCGKYGVTLIEDAAEALGATYKGRSPGVFGKAGIFSFNGNKIITTSGGGMLVTADADLARHARKLATQARDDAPHYEHSEIGYNYRLSNVLAGIGRGQLRVLDDRVQARRQIFQWYRKGLADLPGLAFMPEAPWGRSTRWLTCITIDPNAFGADREQIRLALEKANIEARPVWKPMHLQPAYRHFKVAGGDVSEALFRNGLCLPSGSSLTESDVERIVEILRNAAER
ncbi:MAG TPA: aminotransferase class I/II-fold pyridoxal phosphate-dependent enzyme [Thermomicrobiales bacterium]|nr:aminotransferase class I/II-fold pyridoxal phosphate-dependent enzyme [Thermomicrobiales bacterium]